MNNESDPRTMLSVDAELREDGTFDLSDLDPPGLDDKAIADGVQAIEELGGLKPSDLHLASVFLKALSEVVRNPDTMPITDVIHISELQYALLTSVAKPTFDDERLDKTHLACFWLGMCVGTYFQELRHS